MERILEPEIMDGEEQARVYAHADFREENQGFVDHFFQLFPSLNEGLILDLGCGPADIPIRLLRGCPNFRVMAIDASGPMITLAQKSVDAAGFSNSIDLVWMKFQDLILESPADAIISNSLVHHIPNPFQFWFAIKKLAKPGAPALIMDLRRPESCKDAEALVSEYTMDEPEQLQNDFFNSLLSSFTEDEVAAHLAEMNLSRLLIDVPDDRHWVVSGHVY